MKVDYVCAACGVQAVAVERRIWVPHLPGCPVAARLARRLKQS